MYYRSFHHSYKLEGRHEGFAVARDPETLPSLDMSQAERRVTTYREQA